MSGSGWRLARSLEVLEAEVRQVAPGTTVWDIGDAAHRAGASDHNPNDDGVVCAIDVLDDAGLDLNRFAEKVRRSGHPALKYLIYRNRFSRGGGWRAYQGQFHNHVHVSVGRGLDGQSTGPYDDTSPWGVAPRDEGDDDMDILGLKLRDGYGDDDDPKVQELRERVEMLQIFLLDAGQGQALLSDGQREEGVKPGADGAGIDGFYGARTAEALRLARKSVGSRAREGWGDKVTSWAAGQLLKALIRQQAGAGEVELPDSVQVSGELDVEG